MAFNNKIKQIVCGDKFSLILTFCGKLYKLINSVYEWLVDNSHIYNCWILDSKYYYLKINGDFYEEDKILFNNKNLTYLINCHILINFNNNFYKNYSQDLKNNTIVLLLSMKRINIKILKLILCNIINHFI